jgi:hypothetical protein
MDLRSAVVPVVAGVLVVPMLTVDPVNTSR